MLLSKLPVGSNACVVSLSALPTNTRNKLFSLGFIPNTCVSVVRVAPLGDPLQVRIRGCDIALSLAIAEKIEVNQDV